MKRITLIVFLSFLSHSAFSEPQIRASSQLKSQFKNKYSVEAAFDGNTATAWIEGVKGEGIGESITVDFPEIQNIYAIMIVPGYTKNPKVFSRNLMPFIKISINGKTFSTVQPIYERVIKFSKSKGTHGEPMYFPSSHPANMAARYFVFKTPIKGQKIQFVIDHVVQSMEVDLDSAISEIKIFTDSNKDSLPKDLDSLKNLKSQPLNWMKIPISDSLIPRDDRCLSNDKNIKNIDRKNLFTKLADYISDQSKFTEFYGAPFYLPINKHIIYTEMSISQSCYSDGEGGTIVNLGLIFKDNQIDSLVLVPQRVELP